MPYSTVGDMLVGDMMFPAGFDKQKYVTIAAEEMDAKLGVLYALPLAPLEGAELPLHERLLLKTINNKLASGRLIMDIAIGSEQAAVHAYASRMVNEATRELVLLANGEVDLSAVRREVAEAALRVPSVTNVDEESLLLGFENTVLRGEGWYSRPGAL